MADVPYNSCRWIWVELTQEWEFDGSNCNDGCSCGDAPTEPGSLDNAIYVADCVQEVHTPT